MALAPGPAAVFRIVPPGDKVALGETVRRVLSASSTPRIVFGGGDARRKLARRASRWTRTAEMVSENMEHTPLICSSGVSEAKGHRNIAVHAEMCDKRSRELVGLFHLDLVIARISIKKG